MHLSYNTNQEMWRIRHDKKGERGNEQIYFQVFINLCMKLCFLAMKKNVDCDILTYEVYRRPVYGLLLKPGPKPWTLERNTEKPGPWRTWNLKNLDPEKPGPWRTWTLKNLDTEKPGHWKTWTLKNMGNGWLWKND